MEEPRPSASERLASLPRIPMLGDILISENHTLLECYRLLNETGYRMLICLEGERVIGILTDSDIRRGILSGIKLEDRIGPILNRHPVVVGNNVSKQAVLALMKERDVDPIPVVNEEGKFVSLYSMNELIKAVALPNSVVIMAGGLGSRLKPLTQNLPKPLLRVNGKTIIEHVIMHLQDYGIESFFVTVNYKSQMIKERLKDGSDLGVRIEYLEEPQKLGTIGAVTLLKDHRIEFPFLVMNGDILTRFNPAKLLEEHKNKNSLMTVCVKKYHYNVPYGVVETNNGRVVGIAEKPEYDFFINAGIYCLSPELIEFIPSQTQYDATMLMNLLLERRIPVTTFVITDYWRDIGNFEDLYGANMDFKNGEIN